MIARLRRALMFALACGWLGALVEANAASRWAIDPSRTRIDFTIDAAAFPQTRGEFKKFEGGIVVDFDHPERSHVEFHVDSASVEVGSTSFNSYVRGQALLDASHFPTIGFASTSVKKVDDRTVRVTGNLTMLGVTRPLAVDVDVKAVGSGSRQRLGFIAKAKIDRLDFGMNSGFPVISRQVDLVISSEAYES